MGRDGTGWNEMGRQGKARQGWEGMGRDGMRREGKGNER